MRKIAGKKMITSYSNSFPLALSFYGLMIFFAEKFVKGITNSRCPLVTACLVDYGFEDSKRKEFL
jgi:hypothetical protein